MELLILTTADVYCTTDHHHLDIQCRTPTCKLEPAITVIHALYYQSICWPLPHNCPILVFHLEQFQTCIKTTFRITGPFPPSLHLSREARHNIFIQIWWAYRINWFQLIQSTPYLWQYHHATAGLCRKYGAVLKLFRAARKKGQRCWSTLELEHVISSCAASPRGQFC